MLKLKTSTLRVHHFRLKRQIQKERESQDEAPPPKSSKSDTGGSPQIPASHISAEIHQDFENNTPSNEQLDAEKGEDSRGPQPPEEILNVEERDLVGPPIEPKQASSTNEGNVCLCKCCENCRKGQNIRDESHIREDVKKMAKRLSIPYSHLSVMLKTFKPYHPTLPLSARTLLGHHEKPTIETHLTGDAPEDTAEFVYFGISDHLQKTVNVKFHPEKVLKLQFNFDGLTLFNSSSREFWTGLGKVYTKKNHYDPFVVQVHSGVGKPKCVCQYLWKFILEINHLLAKGIIIDGVHFKVEIKSMVCDTPARAFIKSVKGHTGFYACERCTVRGFKVDNTTVYPLNEGILRTDESFRNRANEEHHHELSPLLLIDPPINMIILFVLDFMHLVCLGTTKKLISDFWLTPSYKILTRNDILRVSARLGNLNNQIPAEFQRTTKSLQKFGEFKATEYRFITLYSGMFVFKDILPEPYYKHFLLLCIGCRILCSQDYHKKYFNQAKQYLDKFVRTASHPSLYGLKALVINLHNLSHLADDVENMDCPLMDFSAFPFENLLGKLKKLVESGNKPLAQLINKIFDYFSSEKAQEKPDFEILKEKKERDEQGLYQYQRIRLLDCELSTKRPENVVLLKTGEIIAIISIKAPSKQSALSEICIEGRSIEILGPALNYPCDSSALNMFKVSHDTNNPVIKSNLALIKCKMVLLDIFELEGDPIESYAMPLLHMN
ncbi:hypothetical protein QAD02_022995 [Eretmocerus hayati]|uniref:Uncharacterized protein n=1 Tax=Eretmocerus hayati TaxID=131215 RepID=A0ACC2PUJ1_9HYME|nr:hypothetical protein QAD02_022995 [Eretmocerus hayati]